MRALTLPIFAGLLTGTVIYLGGTSLRNYYARDTARAVQEAYSSCLDTNAAKDILEHQVEILARRLDECKTERSRAYEDLTALESAKKVKP